MALIPKNELTVLKTASEVKAVAESAGDELELAAVAALINDASNSGQFSAIYQGRLRESTKESLQSNNYTVESDGNAASSMTKISWKDA